MSLLPSNNTIIENAEVMPSRTYRLDLVNKRIVGMVDNLEAVEQSVLLILNTERYESIIYNWYYGVEIDDLIGQNFDFVKSEIKRTINDALMQDDRILEISDMVMAVQDSELHIEFTVVSNIGSFDIRKEIAL